MLEYGLFTLWRKIQFYRVLIISCLCLSALTVTSGFVAAYFLYDGAFQLSYQIAAVGEFSDVTAANWEVISQQARREGQLVNGLIFIAVATLLFGIVIPGLVFHKLISTLKELERQLRETLRDMAKSFSSTLDQYGETPFVNAQYWAEIAMIALEFVGRDSRNPSLMLMADLSGLTRAEMGKIRRANPSDKKTA